VHPASQLSIARGYSRLQALLCFEIERARTHAVYARGFHKETQYMSQCYSYQGASWHSWSRRLRCRQPPLGRPEGRCRAGWWWSSHVASLCCSVVNLPRFSHLSSLQEPTFASLWSLCARKEKRAVIRPLMWRGTKALPRDYPLAQAARELARSPKKRGRNFDNFPAVFGSALSLPSLTAHRVVFLCGKLALTR
jgi:hypothetical protein